MTDTDYEALTRTVKIEHVYTAEDALADRSKFLYQIVYFNYRDGQIRQERIFNSPTDTFLMKYACHELGFTPIGTYKYNSVSDFRAFDGHTEDFLIEAVGLDKARNTLRDAQLALDCARDAEWW